MRDGSRNAETREEETKQENNSSKRHKSFEILLESEGEPININVSFSGSTLKSYSEIL